MWSCSAGAGVVQAIPMLLAHQLELPRVTTKLLISNGMCRVCMQVEVMADSLVLMTDWVNTAPVPEATPSIMDVMQVVLQQAVIGSGLTVLGSLGASPAGALGWDIRIFQDRYGMFEHMACMHVCS